MVCTKYLAGAVASHFAVMWPKGHSQLNLNSKCCSNLELPLLYKRRGHLIEAISMPGSGSKLQPISSMVAIEAGASPSLLFDGEGTGLRKPWATPHVIVSTSARGTAGGTITGFGYDGHAGTPTTSVTS